MSYRGKIQANTEITVKVGPFLDSSDGNTNETGLSISQADIRLSKNGGNFAQVNHNQGGGNLSHDELGYYDMTLDTTDTNTEGRLLVVVHESGGLLVELSFNVVAQAAYISEFTAKDSGYMDVNIKAISDDTTAPDNLELDYDGTGYNKANSTIGTTTANTDMRGTDSAALASVLGALDDAAAAGDPTNADTVMKYVKQLINILIGTDGIGTFPAEAAPGNAVSLAEVIRAIHVDVTGLNGDAMRGTDGANTTVPDAAGTAAGLHTTTDSKIDTVDSNVDAILLDTGTDGVVLAADSIKAATYDESTAYPIKSADTGATQIARVGADGDTLETLSDQIDGVYSGTPPTAAAIVNEWESQSQADPTGFHVNVKEVNGTAQTANDNGADINAILTDTDELQGLISDSKLPAQVEGMDADVLAAAALKADAVTKISDDIFAEIVDGTIDLKEALLIAVAVLAGDVDKSTNTYTYKDQSAATKVTKVVSDSAVEVTIA